ncbi:unnamed protein product [Bursaphelenchus okinawaensis]|uniref:L-Fucosyltransferase n=1 Tax=Bursaphelenchus okinawaensis TaxID=465554 RepID=A0A811L748_9BILA|nr:unnamed protein product [Bursaphelenchus okinawaensis]CAG9118142.1 unnamed protein product [Bursaphelenchus okinawaensis]
MAISINQQLVSVSKIIIIFGLLYLIISFYSQDYTPDAIGQIEQISVRLKRSAPDKYIGLAFGSCNGLANQMQRHASLLGIGKQINRTPFIDDRSACSRAVLPELVAAMPNFYKGILLLRPNQPKKAAVPFNVNICQFVNASVLDGKYESEKYVKLRSYLLQSYKYFHYMKPEIREVFKFSVEQNDFVNRFAMELMGNSTSHKVCVHSRRGDFVHHPFLLASKHSFTNPALQFITNRLKKEHKNLGLILIGEDKKFDKDVKYDKNIFKEVYHPSGLSRTQDMLFSSKYCDTLLITASGSTFGWWIGYLMAEEKQKNIFYNFVATKNAKDCRDRYDFDTYPPEWTRLRLQNGTNGHVVVEKRWHKEIVQQEKAEVYRKWLKF